MSRGRLPVVTRLRQSRSRRSVSVGRPGTSEGDSRASAGIPRARGLAGVPRARGLGEAAVPRARGLGEAAVPRARGLGEAVDIQTEQTFELSCETRLKHMLSCGLRMRSRLN